MRKPRFGYTLAPVDHIDTVPDASDSILGYVVSRLQASKGRWREIAEKSHVPKRTLEKIAMGETADPGIQTVEKLLRCLRDEEIANGASGESAHRVS